MSTVWNGQARPRRGTKPRRLEHPERARWLLYPDGSQYQAAVGSGPDPGELEEYAKAWDRHEAAAREALRAEFAVQQEARFEEDRRHRAVEEMRIQLEGPARRVQERLAQGPQHYAIWWERLEAWLDKNPPHAAHGSVGDPERKIDEYDVYRSERMETKRLSKAGWPKGRRHSQETKNKISRIRQEREAEGTWGRRGRMLKTEFKPKTYEELAREAASNDS